MRNILSLFLTINIVVGTSVAPVAYADGSASEHYEKYVNKMIPLSFDLARQDAILRESALIFQRISEIQEHLTIGTEHTLKIEALAPLISRYAVNSCNSQIIEDNVWNNYQNLLFNLSQIKNTLKSYDENKSKLNALFNSFPTACNSDFSKYTTSLLPSSFQKTTIEAEDGVYVEFAPILLIVTAFESLLQIFGNKSEMAKIEELTEKYKNDSVKDSHYQEYAKTACLAQIKSHQPLVDEFQEIATRLDASISQLNRVQFEQTHARVLACVNSYPDHLAFHIKKISHQIADKKIAPLINATHKSDMKLRISSEVFKLVDVLKQKACGQGFEPIQSLRDLIGLSRFHNSNETMMQKVEAYLEGREDLCKGAFL